MFFSTLISKFTLVLLACAMFLCSAMPAMAQPSGTLTIYHAGSLTVPFKKMAEEFKAKYPKVDIVTKAGGSTKMARLISENGETADIMASADYVVIDKNLIPKFASWNVRFAANQIVLCYTAKSRMADKITPTNWYEILQEKDVVWGHSDPNLDPCGYRSVMVLQLAELFYDKPGLFDATMANRPIENVKPKAKELVALLKNGKMDYAFEYLSVAVQHGLKYVPLDKHINLSDIALNPFYKQAIVTVTGKTAGTTINRIGKSITYGVTLLDKARNREAAEAFLAYLFDQEGGLKVLKDMGQPPFVPVRTPADMMGKLPESLKGLVEAAK